MGMATYTDDTNLVRNEFAHLKTIFDRLKSEYFPLESRIQGDLNGYVGRLPHCCSGRKHYGSHRQYNIW